MIQLWSKKGNDEMLSDPTLDYAVTTLVPNMSGDEIKSEDTQMRTFSISGHTDNLTNDEENLKGFRQIQRRRSKNSISKMPPHEATEETNIWIFSGMFQKMKTTGISRSLG
ncbi:unnamed protein product [Cuscuta europaea]|uniref:Uncharacterized protein n=1 Tax=Cuscuta europaea TaxID=41803 RepID=A0A9P0YQ04_CUSEU|nr:unnamed protein product [Cuscuta europaea]